MENIKNIVEILLIEDNLGDVDLTRDGLKDSKIPHTLHVCTDGTDAMAFLRNEGKYVGAPRPDLILLDLNLPKKDGREVLAEIKYDPSFKAIPVIVLTSSHAEIDVAKSYEHHANAYVAKPVDLNGFVNVINEIEKFWFSVVSLPNK